MNFMGFVFKVMKLHHKMGTDSTLEKQTDEVNLRY